MKMYKKKKIIKNTYIFVRTAVFVPQLQSILMRSAARVPQTDTRQLQY